MQAINLYHNSNLLQNICKSNNTLFIPEDLLLYYQCHIPQTQSLVRSLSRALTYDIKTPGLLVRNITKMKKIVILNTKRLASERVGPATSAQRWQKLLVQIRLVQIQNNWTCIKRNLRITTIAWKKKKFCARHSRYWLAM